LTGDDTLKQRRACTAAEGRLGLGLTDLQFADRPGDGRAAGAQGQGDATHRRLALSRAPPGRDTV